MELTVRGLPVYLKLNSSDKIQTLWIGRKEINSNEMERMGWQRL
jgi:hypothetical protein